MDNNQDNGISKVSSKREEQEDGILVAWAITYPVRKAEGDIYVLCLRRCTTGQRSRESDRSTNPASMKRVNSTVPRVAQRLLRKPSAVATPVNPPCVGGADLVWCSHTGGKPVLMHTL